MFSIRCKDCKMQLTPEQSGLPCPRCGSRDRDSTGVDQAAGSDRAAVAKRLADAHFSFDPGITAIYTVYNAPAFEACPDEPIKLLEANQNTIASGVMPLGFDPVPQHGIPYPSVIIEVTPDELIKIQNKELLLPDGWTLGSQLAKPEPECGSE